MKIKQEPFNSTLMSSLKAAYKYYYGKNIKNSDVFGLTGMAFTVAFSKGIGPCAPYTFNMDALKQLCKENLGLTIMQEEYPVTSSSSETERIEATSRIKSFLNDGYLVLLNTYEVQLITGYNETHFFTTKPWDAESVTPDIELNTLDGIKDFLMYSKIEKTERIDKKQGLKKVINYAKSQFNVIETMDFIKQGINAYDFALEEINEENYKGHGMWWVSCVWFECKMAASMFFKDHYSNIEISKLYKELANIFAKLSNKEEYNLQNKIDFLKTAKELEIRIRDLL